MSPEERADLLLEKEKAILKAKDAAANIVAVINDGVRIAQTIASDERLMDLCAKAVADVGAGAAKVTEALITYQAKVIETVADVVDDMPDLTKEANITTKIRLMLYKRRIKRSWKAVSDFFNNVEVSDGAPEKKENSSLQEEIDKAKDTD